MNYLNVNRAGTSGTTVASGGLSVGDEDSGSEDTSNLHSRIITTSTTDFWQELQGAIEIIVGSESGRKVAMSPQTGVIVVQAMPSELRKVESFLNKAQGALNKQVILDAKVLEVELNDGFQSGINWGYLNGQLRATQIGSGTLGCCNIRNKKLFVPHFN